MSLPSLRALLPTLALWLFAFGSQAQLKDDHLVPGVDHFISYDFQNQYYPKLREVLYAGLSDSPLARVVVRPSFEPEYVISVDRQGRKYYLTYQVCQPGSVWSALEAKTDQKVGVETKKAEISPDLATAVAQLFGAAINQVKYPEPTLSMRGDGTTYTFITFQAGLGARGGETWSPAAGTRMAALVSFAGRLPKLAAPTPADSLLQTGLLRAAQLLRARLLR